MSGESDTPDFDPIRFGPAFARTRFIRPYDSRPWPVDDSEGAELHGAVRKSRDWLLARQNVDGHWRAELEGDSILQSETILLLAWLGRQQTEDALGAARRLEATQLPGGGWGMYPGGKLEISGSVKAYFALKLTGRDPESEPMARARQAILAAGGADQVNSFTRFYLALLGQIPWSCCPAVPPEICLLPGWSPVSLDRMSAWSRTIVVPLSIMWAHRPTREVPKERGIAELFVQPPERWATTRCPGLKEQRGWFSWDNFFRQADRAIKTMERWGVRPMRRRALAVAKKWMLDRFEESDGLGAIFPPIVWSVIALKCLGYADDSPEVRYNFEQLDGLKIWEGDRLRLQPCLSPVWDTAISVRAIAAARAVAEEPMERSRCDAALDRAVDWLLSREVKRKGDWARRAKAAPGGWFFEYRNEFYPDVDDTIMVLMGLREATGAPLDDLVADDFDSAPIVSDRVATAGLARIRADRLTRVVAAAQRAKAWVLAMQNRDGGWGAFDRDNDSEFLCRVPFADHNAMIDPSTPDIAARTLEAMAIWGMPRHHPAAQRAIDYVLRSQEPDGAWPGRWGVNYLYGTWQTLVGLRAIGVGPDHPAMIRGGVWLRSAQQADGAWGETADSYEFPELRGKGPPTASQTAWAILGLVAAGQEKSDAVVRGLRWLRETQRADGSWNETEFTGTGFPRVFYLRYHYYAQYFPLLAIATALRSWNDDRLPRS